MSVLVYSSPSSWEKLWSPLVVMPSGVCSLTSGEVSEKQNLVVSPSPGRNLETRDLRHRWGCQDADVVQMGCH